jgi:hypothetical protein
MYLWKVDSLVEDFKSGRVSQKEEFKYMLISVIVMVFASDPVLHIGYSYNYYDAIGSVVTLGISMLGIYYCYKINSSGDNKDFVVRVMCIGLPVVVRVLAVMIPVFSVVGILEAVIFYPKSLAEGLLKNTPIQVAFVLVFMVAYYWYLSTKIKAVSSKNG